MASAKRFSLYTASFVHAGGTLDINQLESFSVEPTIQRAEVIPGGLNDRSAVLIASAQPRVRFATRDLATLMATVSISGGLALTGAATFRMQERTSGGTFETGATQETWAATGGFLYVDSFSASQDDVNGVIANCIFIPLWDGTNDPLIHNTGVDFTLVTAPAFVSNFYLGPIYHAGAALDGIQNVTVNAGVNYEAKAFNGDPYPRLGAIVTRQPTIQFTTAKVDAGGALAIFGRAISTGVVVYFQKAVDSGTRVAAATSQHVKITAASGDWSHDDVSVTGNDDGTLTFMATPKSTLAISVASAIP
jgi:hypothetical protein